MSQGPYWNLRPSGYEKPYVFYFLLQAIHFTLLGGKNAFAEGSIISINSMPFYSFVRQMCAKKINLQSREGSDLHKFRFRCICLISTHAPREGSDKGVRTEGYKIKKFQPTLPVWGATHQPDVKIHRPLFQPTLPVWGATPRACGWRE